MDIILIKKYLCIVCKKQEIIERMTKHPYEGEVPDQSNCDFSTYSHHEVIGGNLLKNRPGQTWGWLTLMRYREHDETIPMGGICDLCLHDEVIAGLVSGKHINFTDEEDMRKSARQYY